MEELLLSALGKSPLADPGELRRLIARIRRAASIKNEVPEREEKIPPIWDGV